MKNEISLNLRSLYTSLLVWLGAREKTYIVTKKNSLAQLLPKNKSEEKILDWTKSAAFMRDRSHAKILTAEDIAYALGRDVENFQ